MEAIIKDQKQMIHYLHTQAADHVKTRTMLIEMNEELEKEIIEKDEIIFKVKKELENKERRLNVYEEDTFNKSVDVDRLLEEIILIKKLNKEKEDTLAIVVKENESLQENLALLEKETEKLKTDVAINDQDEFEQNLSDELGILDPRALNVSPACEQSNVKNHDVNHHRESLVKKIWKLKQMQLEKSINLQKFNLTSNILQLKEREFPGSEICSCKGYCRILHQKHNWKKSMSQEIYFKFKTLDNAYCCENCDKTFQNVDCLKLHMKTVHEEGKMGEISSKASGGRLI